MAEGGEKGIVSQIRLIKTFVDLELFILFTYTTGGRLCGVLTSIGGVARCCGACADDG
jgi:hypothetical protein